MKITLSICFTQMFSQGMEAQYNRNAAVDLAQSAPRRFFRKQLI